MSLPPTLHVIVPDQFNGLAVCDLGMLMDSLMEGEPLDVAVEASVIDTISNPADASFTEHVERIRRLNLTGDGGAYWGPRQDGAP